MKKVLFSIALILFSHYSFSEIYREAAVVNFKKNSFELSENAKNKLEALLDWTEFRGDYAYYIAGHTDTDGSQEYNEKLSFMRAQSVSDFLISKGADPSKLKVEFKGEHQPLLEDLDEGAMESNRRVVIEYVRYEFKSIEEMQREMTQENLNVYTLETNKTQRLETKAGIKIQIEPDSFIDADGNVVKGKVEVKVVDALDPRAFVGEGLSTMSGEDVLLSGGMFKFEVRTENGEKLSMAEGKNLKICIPSEAVKPGMSLYVSEDGNDWTNTEKDITAVNEEGEEQMAFPKKNYPKFVPPVFRTETSERPQRPYEPIAPKVPSKPVLENFRTDYKWHDLDQKKKKEWDKSRFNRAMIRYEKDMLLHEQRLERFQKKCEDFTIMNNQYEEVLAYWRVEADAQRAEFERDVVAPEREKYNKKYGLEMKAYEEECADYERTYGVKLNDYAARQKMLLAKQDPGSYLFETRNVNKWSNTDQIFRMNISVNESMTVQVDAEGSANQELWLVENNGATMVPVKRNKKGNYKVKKTRKSTSILVAYKVEDGQLYSYFGEVTDKNETVDYSLSTYLELNEKLSQLRN